MPLRFLAVCLFSLSVLGCTSPPASPRVAASIHQSSNQPRYQNGAVAADSAIASDAGVSILKRGGNAVDAAVATGFTLAVVRPFSCGLGGGGFMIIHDPSANDGNGESWALDYREVAPDGIGPTFYEDQPPTASGYAPSVYGGRSTGVPGEIPGLLAAHARFGSLDLATVLAPATRAAYEGFAIDASYVSAIKRVASIRAKHPDLRPMSRWLWMHLCGSGTLSEGDVIRQPELAEFLARLSEEGIDAWRGESPQSAAPLVAGANRAYDGQLTAQDIRTYEPRWRKPLIAKNVFQDYDAVLMPPPSSGGVVLLQVLSILNARLPEMGRPSMDSPEFTHLLAEALKHGFADRARYLADPDFAPVPIDLLCDRAALRALAKTIDLTETKPSDAYGLVAPPPDDRGTSHYSVIDRNGMTVAATETINATFGSLVVVPELGIVLNNELDDFTTIRGKANLFGLRQSDWNLPQPGKRPLSSMSPTILLREGRTAVTAGASGGPRIITGTLQVLLRIIYQGDAPVDAVNAPRIHHQWLPDQLLLEDEGFTLQPSLEAFGHTIKRTGGVGVVQVIRATPNGLEPASDPRKGGRASGY